MHLRCRGGREIMQIMHFLSVKSYIALNDMIRIEAARMVASL